MHERDKLRRTAQGALLIGAACLGIVGIVLGRTPLGIGAAFLGFLMLLIVVVGWLCKPS